MAIGRTFQESLQKALRGLETGARRLQRRDATLPLTERIGDEARHELRAPGADRLLYVADAFRAGWSLDAGRTRSPTSIRGSSSQIEDIVTDEERIIAEGLGALVASDACARSSARASPIGASQT